MFTGQTLLTLYAQYTFTGTQTDLWLSQTNPYSHMFILNAQMPSQEGGLLCNQEQPNVCLSPSSGIVHARAAIRLRGAVVGQTRLSVPRQRTALLFLLYSSRQHSDWGSLTQCNPRPWWIAALNSAAKESSRWSVVTLHKKQAGLSESVSIENSVCTVLCPVEQCRPVCFTMETLGMMPYLVDNFCKRKAGFTAWLTGLKWLST